MYNNKGCFGFSASITAQDAMALLKITDTLSKTAERAAKIQDRNSLRLEWGNMVKDSSTMCIEEIIIPEIPEQNRLNLALKMKKFFSTMQAANQPQPLSSAPHNFQPPRMLPSQQVNYGG